VWPAIVVALAFWRFRREPRWFGPVRFLLAMFIVWIVLMSWESRERWQRMHDRKVAGDTHAFDYDTGGGAAMALLGWIPATVSVGLLWGLRMGFCRILRHRKTAI